MANSVQFSNSMYIIKKCFETYKFLKRLHRCVKQCTKQVWKPTVYFETFHPGEKFVASRLLIAWFFVSEKPLNGCPLLFQDELCVSVSIFLVRLGFVEYTKYDRNPGVQNENNPYHDHGQTRYIIVAYWREQSSTNLKQFLTLCLIITVIRY